MELSQVQEQHLVNDFNCCILWQKYRPLMHLFYIACVVYSKEWAIQKEVRLLSNVALGGDKFNL